MHVELDEEDILFFSKINQEIDEQTDKEYLLRSKTVPNLDIKAIREKKEKEFFNSIKVQLESLVTECMPIRELLQKDNIQIYEKLSNAALDPNTLIEKSKNYNSLKELKNVYKNILTPEELKEISDLGNSYFDHKDFEKAYLYFLFLTFLNPLNADNYLFKGMAEQNMKKYNEALLSYSLAATLDPTQLLTYLQIIDCFILSQKLEEAKLAYAKIENEIDPSTYENDPFYLSKVKAIKYHLAKIR